MSAEADRIKRRQKADTAHFGAAERSAYSLGALHGFEVTGEDAAERVQAALDRALHDRSYDSDTKRFLTAEGGHWHTLGSLGMYELFGYSETGARMAAAVNLLIDFAVDQAVLDKSRSDIGGVNG